MKPVKSTNPTAIFKDFELLATTVGLKSRRLLATDQSIEGLLLTVGDPYPAMNLEDCELTFPKQRNEKEYTPTGYPADQTTDLFLARLTEAISQTHRARLPAALLLVAAKAGSPPASGFMPAVIQEALAVLEDLAGQDSLTARHGDHCLALLLSGASLGRATSLARLILTELDRQPSLNKLPWAAGIAVAPAGSEASAAKLLELAEGQLSQARLATGPERISHALYDAPHLSCQVTAEERAVLFLRPQRIT